MTGLGDKFRLARESKNITLQRVSEALRIQKSFLESMESDNWNDLPGLAYAVGFSRIYSRYLNINVKEEIEDLKNYYLERSSDNVRPHEGEQFVNSGNKNWWGISLACSLLVFTFVFAWFSIGQEVRNYVDNTNSENNPKQSTAENKIHPDLISGESELNNTSIATATNKKSFDLRKDYSRIVKENDDRDTVQNELRVIDVPTKVIQSSHMEPQYKTTSDLPPLLEAKIMPLTQDNMDIGNNKNEYSSNVGNKKGLAFLDDGITASIPQKANPISLEKTGKKAVIKAIDSVWLRLETNDGDILFSEVLKRGESVTLPEKKENIILATRNVAALSYEYDGKSLKPIDSRGGAIAKLAIKDIIF